MQVQFTFVGLVIRYPHHYSENSETTRILNIHYTQRTKHIGMLNMHPLAKHGNIKSNRVKLLAFLTLLIKHMPCIYVT